MTVAAVRGVIRGRREAGVALAIVIWFIAGMSLLVAGIVALARVDTQMSQVHVARAKVVAAGDGAINLMLLDLMMARDQGGSEQPSGNYRIGGIETRVILQPVAGLVDVNSASVEVLAAMFLLVGGLGDDQARLLAQNVVQSRTRGPGQSGQAGGVELDTIEDLLRVPGASRTLLDSVRDFIVVGESGQGATDWAQAPAALQEIVAKASPELAATAAARRGNSGNSNGASADAGQAWLSATAFRADAIVRYGDKIWLRRRWIDITSVSSSTLPWRVVRTEPPRVLMEDSYLLGRAVDA